MDLAAAMDALTKAGSDAGRRLLAARGIDGPAFGVAPADVERLARRIGKDPALAEALWRSGNHDARALSIHVDDPAALPPSRLEARAREMHRALAEPLAARLAAASPHATALAERWTRDAGGAVTEAGWHVVAALSMRPGAAAPDAWFAARLAELDGGLARAPASVRGAMTVALVGIGSRSDALAAAALEAANRVGPVEVETPDGQRRVLDAAPAISRARAQARSRADRFGMHRDRA